MKTDWIGERVKVYRYQAKKPGPGTDRVFDFEGTLIRWGVDTDEQIGSYTAGVILKDNGELSLVQVDRLKLISKQHLAVTYTLIECIECLFRVQAYGTGAYDHSVFANYMKGVKDYGHRSKRCLRRVH